nr:hypothetical protein [Streptomyces phaeoluteigriseus]
MHDVVAHHLVLAGLPGGRGGPPTALPPGGGVPDRHRPDGNDSLDLDEPRAAVGLLRREGGDDTADHTRSTSPHTKPRLPDYRRRQPRCRWRGSTSASVPGVSRVCRLRARTSRRT